MAFLAAAFANISGAVRGVFFDSQHLPIAGATVKLDAKLSDWEKTETTGRQNGEFQSNGVPLGDYSVTVSSANFASAAQDVTVISGTVPVVHVQLQVNAAGDLKKLM